MIADSPVVSVVIIFYNEERFLSEAVESVLAQSYPGWELLLVDDGSSDQSGEIAREYARQDPGRICYLAHPNSANRGMSASRNLGIRYAQGEYIAFLDADDVWFPDALAEQTFVLDEHPRAALVYGTLQYWYSWTGDPADEGRDTIESLGVSPDTLIRPPKLVHLFLRDLAAVPSGIMVRREAIERYGGFVDAFRGEYEDQAFCARICLRAPVYASSQCWYRYRQHPDSSVSRGLQTGDTLAARRFFLDWLETYLHEQGIRDRKVRWAVKWEQLRYTHPRLFSFIRRNRHRLPRGLRP